MGVPVDEHERTMAFADIALGQIRALRQPASPRHFEIWYTYATGYNPSLNQMINEALKRSGTLNEADIDQIYDTYFSVSRLSASIDHVGSQVIGLATDEPAVRAVVESLVQATKEMEKNNEALETRLTASKNEITQLQQNLETVRNESLTDPLTSLANRKHFDDALAKAAADARSRGDQLSLMMADIDHFKRFNDSYGHLTGDQVLRLVAMSVKQNIKGQDIAARYGGEEFAVVLPNTVLRSAITVADHIRRAVMGKELMKRSTGEHLGRVTISIGVAALRPDDTQQSLIERADSCLYAAKRSGRNRVISDADPEIAQAAAATKVA